VITELKQLCINTMNDKLTAFPTSLRDALIERVRTAEMGGGILYWYQGLCDYHEKSLMSGKTIESIDREKCPSTQFYDCVPENFAQTFKTEIIYANASIFPSTGKMASYVREL